MSRRDLIRYGGPAAVLGGALFVVVNAAILLLLFLFEGAIKGTFFASHAFLHIMDTPMYALLALGVLGLYLRQSGRFGWPGKVGFCLTFGGFAVALLGGIAIIVVGIGVGEAATLGVLDIVTHPLAMLLYTVGSVIFGAATLRAGVLPRGGALLLVVGSPLWFVFVVFLGRAFEGAAALIYSVPALVFAAGWMWLGHAASEESDVPVEPRPAVR